MADRFWQRGRALWVLTALIIGLVAPVAQAQRDFSFGPTTTPRAMLADRLATLARIILAGEEEPRPDQFARARVLLDEALRLNPEDTELWTLRRLLAVRLNDVTGGDEALRQYVRLDPNNDAAQLELVFSNVGRLQTLDQRIDALDRLVNSPDSAKLTPALRSRLASYAASLAAESGDMGRFGRYLRQAVQLDVTNLHAAGLTFELAVSRNGSPLEQGIALLSMVRASPTDPQLRWRMGSLLLAQGAFERAAEQFMAARAVSTGREQIDNAAEHYGPWLLSMVGSGQLDDAVKLVTELEAVYATAARDARARLIEQARKDSDEGVESNVDFSSVPSANLPSELEVINLVVRNRAGHEDAADGAFTRIRTELAEAVDAGQPLAKANLGWIMLLFNREIDTAEMFLRQVEQENILADNPVMLSRLRGWLELRRGRAESARAVLEPIIKNDPFSAYGYARTFEPANHPQRVETLQHIVQTASSGLAGMLAAGDLLDAGQAVKPLQAGVVLGKVLDEWPAPLRLPDLQDYPWVSMDVVIDPEEYGYLEPIDATITIRNLSDTPLSFAAGGTIPTQAFVFLSPRRGGKVYPEPAPLVIDVGRRLRLEPRQAMEFKARLDRGSLGDIFARSPTETITFSLTAILDPLPTPDGMIVAGMMGATDMIRLVERHGYPITQANLADWQRSLAPTTDPVQRLRALAVMVQITARSGDVPDDNREVLDKIIDSVVQGYGRQDEIGKAWTLLFLESSPAADDMFRGIHEAAQRSESPLVRIAYLIQHVRDPQSPVLNAAIRSDNLRLSDFAQAHRDGLIREAEEAARPRTEPARQQ